MAVHERFTLGNVEVNSLTSDEAERLELLNPRGKEVRVFREPAAVFIEREDGQGYDVRQGGYTDYGEGLSTSSGEEKKQILPHAAKRRIGSYPRT